MSRTGFICVMLALAMTLRAQQPNPLLPQQEAIQLERHVVELIESTSTVVPGLARASAPVLENSRQALRSMELSSTPNSELTHVFLTEARAYISLYDAVPKPYPFPQEARRQFVELRDSLERIDAHFRAMLAAKETQLRTPDRDNVKRYAEENDRLPQPSPDNPRVVFLGDSITDLWRLKEYFTGRDFLNRGIGGQITGEMLGRMQPDVIELKPRAVLVLAGTNDIARGVQLTTIENNLRMIAALADYHNIKPLFASVLPVSDYHKNTNPQYERTKQRSPALITALNNWLRDFCQEHHYTYVDYYSALADNRGALPADAADDGLHPNGKGYRLMAPAALAAIDGVVKPSGEPGKRRRRPASE